MEDAVRADRADELLHRPRVGELAVEERHAARARRVGLTRAGGVAALDDVEDALRGERVEVFHTRAPAVRAEDRDVRVLGEYVLRQVTAGESGDTGDQDAHRSKRSKRRTAGRLAGREEGRGPTGHAPPTHLDLRLTGLTI